MNRNNWAILLVVIATIGLQSCGQNASNSESRNKAHIINVSKGLDYSKLGDQNPCDFFNIKNIIAKFDLEGSVTFKMTPGNSAELPHCEAHWQIEKDSVRIIRTFVFQNKQSKGFMDQLMKSCRETKVGEPSHVAVKHPDDCAGYTVFNWNSLELIPANSQNYIRVEFEYRNKAPISAEEHKTRKSLAIEIAETIVETLRS